jgi:hypothetical protein
VGQGDPGGQHQGGLIRAAAHSITFHSANFAPAGACNISIAVVAAPLAAIAHDPGKVTLADDLKSAGLAHSD